MTEEIKSSEIDPKHSERILLVDDNPTNLQILMGTLEGRGYNLLIAKNGESALTIVRKARPDLILLDIMMPGMDGYEVCRQLKADPTSQTITLSQLFTWFMTPNRTRSTSRGPATRLRFCTGLKMGKPSSCHATGFFPWP
jgi:CheY-like chemotaxis protein